MAFRTRSVALSSAALLSLPLLVGIGASAQAAPAPAATTITDLAGSQSWSVGGDAAGGGVDELSPFSDPTYRDGSLHLATPAPSSRAQVAHSLLTDPTDASSGLSLAKVTSLAYQTYLPTSTPAPQTAPGLQFSMLGCGTTSSSGFTTLNFEPTYNTDQESLAPGSWQSWDAINGGQAKWWSTRQLNGLTAGQGLQATPVTWNQIKAACPSGHAYQQTVSLGSGTAGADGYADGVQLNGATTDFAVTGSATVTANLPATLVTGRTPTTFTGTVTNPADGPDYTNARYDFTLSGVTGLMAAQVSLQYLDTSDNTYKTIPLADGPNGTITGSFGPPTGFALPHGVTNTTTFKVGIAAGAPTGTLTTTNSLVNVDAATGTVVSTIDTRNSTTTVIAPTSADFTVDEPTRLVIGDPATTFTGTVTNGADGQDYSNVRYDIALSGITGLTADQVTLEYLDTASNTYQPIPLTDQPDGSISGYFGPFTGFPLPHDTAITTTFRIAIKSGAPTGTLTTTDTLDTVNASSGAVIAPVATHTYTTTVVGQYVAVTPNRVVDTRVSGNALHNGPLTGGTNYTLDLANTSVPVGQGAYVFNVTAVHPSGVGNLRIGPACPSAATPSTSLINYTLGKDIANDVVVSNLVAGVPCNKFTVYSDTSSTDVLIDLQGYYTSASGFTGVTPTRIVDTRNGLGGVATQIGGGSSAAFPVTDAPVGAKAVAVNITAIGPKGVGNLRVYPDGDAMPTTSNINYTGADKAAFAIVKLPADGKIRVYSDGSAVNVTIDVFGYLPATSTTVAVTPVRVYDSRPATPLGNGVPRTIIVGGVSGVPADAKAVIVSLTAVHVAGTNGIGNLRAYPGGAAQPTVSNINYLGPNTDVANLAVVSLGTGGTMTLATQGAPVDALVDVVGYVPADVPAP